MTSRWQKNKLITNDRIQAGDVIVGLASSGQAEYEAEYNSGVASNGLTSARHDMLSKYYAEKYPETFEPGLDPAVVYVGPYKLTDEVDINPGPFNHPKVAVARDLVPAKITVGKLLLSPTRTYAPVMKTIFENYFDSIHGLVHCSGGGQTKCLKYLPDTYKIVKNDLFSPPRIFQLIAQASGADSRELYQVFNMGHRLEIFTSEKVASDIINVSLGYGIDAKIIGFVEKSSKKELELHTAEAVIHFA
jgi:phosphoribosylformylglycinamidine cyclo-ligase